MTPSDVPDTRPDDSADDEKGFVVKEQSRPVQAVVIAAVALAFFGVLLIVTGLTALLAPIIIPPSLLFNAPPPTTIIRDGLIFTAPAIVTFGVLGLRLLYEGLGMCFQYPMNTFGPREYVAEEDFGCRRSFDGIDECFVCGESLRSASGGVAFQQRVETVRFGIVTSAETNISAVECERCYTADPIDRQFLVAGLDLPDYDAIGDDADTDPADASDAGESDDDDEDEDEDEAEVDVVPRIPDNPWPFAGAVEGYRAEVMHVARGDAWILYEDDVPTAIHYPDREGQHHTHQLQVTMLNEDRDIARCEFLDSYDNLQALELHAPETVERIYVPNDESRACGPTARADWSGADEMDIPPIEGGKP